jgi:hypothetical protein
MEEIMVTIQEGNVKVEVEGVKGVRCLELTQAIEKLLGENISRHLKDDFYGQIEVKRGVFLRQLLQKE